MYRRKFVSLIPITSEKSWMENILALFQFNKRQSLKSSSI